MSDSVNDNIDALINSLEKTDHNNKAKSDALKNSFNQEQKYQNSDEALETSQNQSDLNENDLTDDYFDSDENTQNPNVVKEADARLRNIIIELLKSGSIVYSIDSDEYKKLIMPENMTFVKSYLRNLNLEVVFNSENGLVYIRNLERDDEDDASENSVEDSSLINRAYLTPFKSVLILILRKYYHERFANGETEIVVDIDYIKNALTPYLELSVSESRDSKKLNGALKDLAEYKLIKKLNSEDGEDRKSVV